MASRPTFEAFFLVILSHFGPFWAIVGVKWGGESFGGSRGPKSRLELLLGPFLVILSHFGALWTFFDPFWPFG